MTDAYAIPICRFTQKEKSAVDCCEDGNPKHKCRECANLIWQKTMKRYEYGTKG